MELLLGDDIACGGRGGSRRGQVQERDWNDGILAFISKACGRVSTET